MLPTLPKLTTLPYSQPFKRAALGLFHGKTKLYGNNVPFSKHKTRRTWLPNSHRQSLFSEVMGGMVRTTVTARALRTVDKVCCLDDFGDQVLVVLVLVLVLSAGTWWGSSVASFTVLMALNTQVGGIDNYLLETKPELLGWEGMRLRVMVREQKRANEQAAKQVAQHNKLNHSNSNT
jgi:large subunit ribosomal protein L28